MWVMGRDQYCLAVMNGDHGHAYSRSCADIVQSIGIRL